MSLDPRIFGVTDAARNAEALAQLDRLSRSPAAAVAEYAEALGTVSTTSIPYVDLGGPSISIVVPEGGAFVELYAELEGNDVGNTGSPARATIFEPTDFPAGSDSYLDFKTAGAWQMRRLAPFPGDPAAVGGMTALTFGSVCRYWATAGTKTYSLRYKHLLGNTGSFRNRRLWARVTR